MQLLQPRADRGHQTPSYPEPALLGKDLARDNVSHGIKQSKTRTFTWNHGIAQYSTYEFRNL